MPSTWRQNQGARFVYLVRTYSIPLAPASLDSPTHHITSNHVTPRPDRIVLNDTGEPFGGGVLISRNCGEMIERVSHLQECCHLSRRTLERGLLCWLVGKPLQEDIAPATTEFARLCFSNELKKRKKKPNEESREA